MKTYTDIEQSKKLAEILPIESADMWWSKNFIYYNPTAAIGISAEYSNVYTYKFGEDDIPCWSLAALLEVLPNEISTGENFVDKYQIDIRKYGGGDGTTWYQIAYGNDRGSSGEWHDMINTGEKENIIDCCYQMIVRLKEKDLL